MPGSNALAAAGLMLLLGGAVANYAVGRLDLPRPRILPVRSFPRIVGAWKAGEDRPVSPDVREALPGAMIVDRSYRARGRPSVEVLLLTTEDLEEFHSPLACLPAQGWTITPTTTFPLEGHTVYRLSAEQDSTRLVVWYWYLRDDRCRPPRAAALRPLYNLRLRMMEPRAQGTLFVRLITPDTPCSARTLTTFAEAMWPALEALCAASRERS